VPPSLETLHFPPGGLNPRAKRSLLPHPLGEAEVEELRPGLCHHDVAGLEIPMDDAAPVSAIEGAGNLDRRAHQLGVRGEVGREDLDRDDAIEARVLRAIDLSHPSRAERSEDLVRTESGAGFKRH